MQGSVRFPRSYAFPYIPTRHGIRYLCHADALGTYTPWLRPRDSCPAGSGVQNTMHKQTTYARHLVRDTYNSCPEAMTYKGFIPCRHVHARCTLCPRTRIRHAHSTRKQCTCDTLPVIRTKLVLRLRRGKCVQTRTAFRGLISKSDQSGDRIPSSEV